MITSRNDANSSAYIALFKEAYDFLKANYTRLTEESRRTSCEQLFALRDSVGRFTSVQEYFSHLKDIYDVGGKKYLMLPLDEPVFEINADSRDIIVPPVFKKNGVSVEGDTIAETLVFRINRFFDYADLYAMTCQIVWETADKQQGVDDAFLVDATQDADYLYIMWPLKYNVTRKPGTIKFSVRFHNSQNGGVPSYSFSTKIAAVTINQGQSFFDLNTGWTGGYSNANQEFMNSIVNSKNIAEEDAAAPYFIFDLDEHRGDEGGDQENYMLIDSTQPIPHIEAYVDAVDNPAQLLRVQAATNDTGGISYQWFYVDELDTAQSQNGVLYRLIPSDDYQKTNDTVAVANKVYWKRSGNDYVIADFAASFAAHEDIYEKYSTVTVQKGQRGYNATLGEEAEILTHVVGKYYAKAINTVGSNTDDTNSVTIFFPSPSKPVITTDLEENAYLGANGLGKITVVAELDPMGAKATYRWEYSTSPTSGFTPIFEETTTLTQEQQAKFSTNTEGNELYIDNMPGFYKVVVISTRNYDEAVTASDVVSKVTMPVAKPTIISPTANTAVSSLNGDARLVVKVQPFENRVYTSDRVTYQWYTRDAQTHEIITIEGASGEWDNASDIVYTVPQGVQGGYYCVVTNYIGNVESAQESHDFSVTLFDTETNSSETEIPDVTLPAVEIAVKKVSVVAADENQALSQANQDAITVTQSGNVITVNGDLDALNSYAATNPEGGSGKFIGLDIDTHLTTINGATWNGYPLTNADIEEAASIGLGAGHIVFWPKAENLVANPYEVTIGATGHTSTTLTVRFENTQG